MDALTRYGTRMNLESRNCQAKTRVFKSGIGVYFHDNSPLNISAPLPGKQSNNRAELQAAVKALMVVREKNFGPVQIRTDSGYVKQGITSWIKTWKKNGWRTAVWIFVVFVVQFCIGVNFITRPCT